MLKLDFRQFQCPHPVVETRKAMLANPGIPLEVQLGDETARENVSRLADSQGYQVNCSQTQDGFTLSLTPAEVTPEPATKQDNGRQISGETIVYCNSEQMGQGDSELGSILLKNFFVTLTESESTPAKIFFVNSGVKLACQGSDAIEALNKLACLGVDIASCGLCLEFYHLKDRLEVGRTTNMLEIVEAQASAGRIISP